MAGARLGRGWRIGKDGQTENQLRTLGWQFLTERRHGGKRGVTVKNQIGEAVLLEVEQSFMDEETWDKQLPLRWTPPNRKGG